MARSKWLNLMGLYLVVNLFVWTTGCAARANSAAGDDDDIQSTALLKPVAAVPLNQSLKKPSDALGAAIAAVPRQRPDHPSTLRECPSLPFEPLSPLERKVVGGAGAEETDAEEKAELQSLAAAHVLDDAVVAVGYPVRLSIQLDYGADTRRGSKIWTRIFLGDCQGWRQIAHRKTDEQGALDFTLAERLPPGVYGIAVQVVDDASYVTAALWVVPRGTQTVIFDLSRPLNRSGTELAGTWSPGTQLASGTAELTRLYESEGFLVVYLLNGKTRLPEDATFPFHEQGLARGPVLRSVRMKFREGETMMVNHNEAFRFLNASGLEVIHRRWVGRDWNPLLLFAIRSKSVR